MGKYYLELDSTYRDRNTWPQPGEFAVPFSQSGRNTGSQMIDPVCVGIPLVAWTSNLFNISLPGSTFINCQVIGNSSGPINSHETVLEVWAVLPDLLQSTLNYYRAATVTWTVSSQTSRIKSYTYLGSNRAQLVLVDRVPFTLGDMITINDPTDLSLNELLLFVPNGSANEQSYVGKYVYNESLNQARQVSSYNSATGLLSIPNNVGPWLSTHNYSIRNAVPNYIATAGVGSTSNQVLLPGITTSLQNWFIRIPETVYNGTPIPPQGETRNIVQFNQQTSVATVSPPFSMSPVGLKLELLQLGYDNVNPLTWKYTSSQDTPAYEIKLNRLVIPNTVLLVGNGGSTSYQPYYYVELTNEGIASQINNIYSNNPNATKALFRASMYDLDHRHDLHFLTLKGDDMTQTIRFRLDSTVRMRVYLPTGETFQTMLTDTSPSAPPNPDIQINALFQFSQV